MAVTGEALKVFANPVNGFHVPTTVIAIIDSCHCRSVRAIGPINLGERSVRVDESVKRSRSCGEVSGHDSKFVD